MLKPQNYPQDPQSVWNRFFEISQTPRPSKKEEKIRNYLIQTAQEKNLTYKIDKVGNVIIYVPASLGYEKHPTVILQNHMDMVCDAKPERKINFEKDPIDTYVDGDWLKARETTLGSDNGIGMALALALLDDKNEVKHPPLELFFTVDEETGLHGALHFDPTLLSGKKLINIDTEDWGKIFIGCAGGIDAHFTRKFDEVPLRSELTPYKLTIRGFKGGHSGVDIHQQRGNAIKLFSTILHKGKKLDFQIISLKGGKAHNIIPRDIDSVIAIQKNQLAEWEKISKETIAEWKTFLPENDFGAETDWAISEEKKSHGLSIKDQKELINLLNLMPHGAHKYELHSTEKLVSASNNLAQIRLNSGEMFLETSVRFFEKNECKELLHKLESLEETFSLKLEIGLGYPSWRPEFKKSPLLDLAKETYQKLYLSEAEVKAIHAGLECGIIKDKLKDIDAISIGPTIQSPHSPSERLLIPTVGKTYEYLKAILEKI